VMPVHSGKKSPHPQSVAETPSQILNVATVRVACLEYYLMAAG